MSNAEKAVEIGEGPQAKSAAGVGMVLHIDPNEITRAVADAVLASQIGPAVKKAVEDALTKESGFGRTTVIQQAVEATVLEIIKQMVARECGVEIRLKTKKALVEAGFIDKAVEKVVEELVQKVAPRY